MRFSPVTVTVADGLLLQPTAGAGTPSEPNARSREDGYG